jgi:hypothetical protein
MQSALQFPQKSAHTAQQLTQRTNARGAPCLCFPHCFVGDTLSGPAMRSAAAVLLLAAPRTTAQDAQDALSALDDYTTESAYNIWGTVKPGPGLTDGWSTATPTVTGDFKCFGGVPSMNLCTLAPNYVTNYDPTTTSAASSYLADAGNWQSGTLYNAATDTGDGLSTWCVSCCDSTRTEFIFNETFAMQCPLAANPDGFAAWEAQLEEGVGGSGSEVADPGDCPRKDGTGATCDERLLSGTTSCEALEADGFDCSGCICGADQGLGYAWWQFRFAKKDVWDSTDVVTCDLLMPMDDGDRRYHGYSLTIVVVERSDSTGRRWRGVEKCHAVPIASSAGLSEQALAWWESVGRGDEEPSPCWIGSSPTCFLQQVTVTNECVVVGATELVQRGCGRVGKSLVVST